MRCNQGVAFLRSTSIVNDSRATKEINSLLKAGIKLLYLVVKKDFIIQNIS